MAVLIRIVAIAGIQTQATDHAGRFVRDYDPDAYRGRGRLRTTDDAAQAQRFADTSAALACWKQQSRTVPLRTDGEPNRPMTAYTIEIVPAPDR